MASWRSWKGSSRCSRSRRPQPRTTGGVCCGSTQKRALVRVRTSHFPFPSSQPGYRARICHFPALLSSQLPSVRGTGNWEMANGRREELGNGKSLLAMTNWVAVEFPVQILDFRATSPVNGGTSFALLPFETTREPAKHH